MTHEWTAREIHETASSFQRPCVLMAAAELGVFEALAGGPRSAEALAETAGADPRAMRMLADALTAMEVLTRDGDQYAAAPGVLAAMTSTGPDCKGRSKTVARVGRRDFVALLDEGFLSFERIRMVRLERRERNRSVYGHESLDGRSPGGIG